jgi:hypothetical protein
MPQETLSIWYVILPSIISATAGFLGAGLGVWVSRSTVKETSKQLRIADIRKNKVELYKLLAGIIFSGTLLRTSTEALKEAKLKNDNLTYNQEAINLSTLKLKLLIELNDFLEKFRGEIELFESNETGSLTLAYAKTLSLVSSENIDIDNLLNSGNLLTQQMKKELGILD